jgi:signal peptidase
MSAIAAPLSLRRPLLLADHGSSLILGLAIALLAALLAGTFAGYRPLVDHSDSMRPAIRAGDLVITRSQPATSIRRGDIVSFHDPGRHGELVTHRVEAVQPGGRQIDFLTRGDANRAPEPWAVARSAQVPRMVARVPAIGRGISWMADRWARTLLLSAVALVLGTALLRRIWRP